MSAAPSIAARVEWRRGWTLVLAAASGMALGSIHIYSTGLFMAPLEAEFGWSRAHISSGLTITSVLGVLFAPLFGMLVDRRGARNVALPGATLCSLAVVALSFAGPSIWSWWALWVPVGVAALLLKPTVWSTAVASAITANRGLALGLMLCGSGIGSAVVPLLANALIEASGWRGAYRGVASRAATQ